MRCSMLLAATWSIVMGVGVDVGADQGPPGKPGRRALLVGCTRYPGLEERDWLKGPGNDVALLETLLTRRFGFSADQIVSLVEDRGGEETRPTRANIERGFRELARKAAPGDRVVVLLSGHGSQEPDQAPLDERDGKDEVFLPADTGRWNRTTERVENAILDDEIAAWVGAIRARGASVWLIVDSCHSGGMIRGNDVEVARRLDPHDVLGIPEEALEKAHARGGSLPANPPEDTPGDLPERAGGMVAIYAAQPDETTPELPLPRDQDQGSYLGLLTYTLGEVLSRATTPLSYRQLVRQIHARYATGDRVAPTPAIEGEDQDHAVLDQGGLPDRPAILLSHDEGEDWTINAGALHGITTGSILAVYPVAGRDRPDGQPLGYVRVSRSGLGTFEAEVDPWDYVSDRGTEAENFSDGCRCRPVSIDFGDMRIKVAIDGIVGKDVPAGTPQEGLIPLPEERRERLGDELKEEATEEGALFTVVDDPGRAEWLVRPLAVDRDEVYLVPGPGWPRRGGKGELPPLFGPLGADRATWRERLNQIARVRNLLKVVGGFESAPTPGPARLRADIELRRYADRADARGTPIAWGPRGSEMHVGDILGVRVTNPNREKIELTLLSIDGARGITARFPRATGDDNVLLPGKSIDLPRETVKDQTAGPGSLLAIAVKSKPQADPVDFTFLTEATIPLARGVARDRGGEARTIDSPLGRLLQNAAFAEGSTRGLSTRSLDDYALELVTWKVLAEERAGTTK